MTQYRIVIENSLGCELDSRLAEDESEIRDALFSLINQSEIEPGDVIRIVEVIS